MRFRCGAHDRPGQYQIIIFKLMQTFSAAYICTISVRGLEHVAAADTFAWQERRQTPRYNWQSKQIHGPFKRHNSWLQWQLSWEPTIGAYTRTLCSFLRARLSITFHFLNIWTRLYLSEIFFHIFFAAFPSLLWLLLFLNFFTSDLSQSWCLGLRICALRYCYVQR